MVAKNISTLGGITFSLVLVEEMEKISKWACQTLRS